MIPLPPIVAVEGNIGAGKTTLATLLAERFDRRLILETFSDNPFLPLFYEDPERYAFSVEVFFMAERHKQLRSELAQAGLFTQGTVVDYIFIKTLLFARNSLSEQEFTLFSRLFNAMGTQFPRPGLIVYLHRPVEVLLSLIERRGRTFEQDIKPAYLQAVEHTYLEYLRSLKETPVLILELGDGDFTTQTTLFDEMVALMGQPTNGLRSVRLRG